MSHKRVGIAPDPDKALIQAVAMDIGKEVVAYVERMYPNAIRATSSGFKLSLRNMIHNEIMAALEITDPDEIQSRLKDREKSRRKLRALHKNVEDTDWERYRERKAEPTK